jgi:hypothetical protein
LFVIDESASLSAALVVALDMESGKMLKGRKKINTVRIINNLFKLKVNSGLISRQSAVNCLKFSYALMLLTDDR